MTEELKPYIVPRQGSENKVDPATLGQRTPEELGPDIVEALRTVYDPEIPVNIYDLGLIYGFKVDDNYFVDVTMTLTAPGCPVAETFPGIVENAVKSVVGVSDAHVELVFDPPWTMDNMSEEAKLELGMI
ncbi:MAG: SUF system Fe-S cluster assembly protein [Gammaproteobacteria bacterium]|nr:SUF system Fe-S cluster assembly protein [Gammaproteobacteria bacterium]